MKTKVKYEFICDPKDGREAVLWGYRSNKKAARKRLSELEAFFHGHGHPEAVVECIKVVVTETRHPANLENDDG